MSKNKIKITLRIIWWLFYLFGGFVLYFKSHLLKLPFEEFIKFSYPLSLFWCQIRLKNKERWLPVNNKLSTSQAWFKLIPVFQSFITVIIMSVYEIRFLIKLIIDI